MSIKGALPDAHYGKKDGNNQEGPGVALDKHGRLRLPRWLPARDSAFYELRPPQLLRIQGIHRPCRQPKYNIFFLYLDNPSIEPKSVSITLY